MNEQCMSCEKPLIDGERVLFDVSGEYIHADCSGPEREGYVKDVGTGEPLGPNDPIPAGFIWKSDQ